MLEQNLRVKRCLRSAQHRLCFMPKSVIFEKLARKYIRKTLSSHHNNRIIDYLSMVSNTTEKSSKKFELCPSGLTTMKKPTHLSGLFYEKLLS